ncbi:MAG: hypothetical protein MJ154_01205 [Candidatus Saccharibacteria bacterium]|nr:hypothetical protein [Candidatus Saccharibacteria bacterium]
MGLNFKLIKRTTNTTTSDVAHSTGYAGVSNGGNFGSSDNTTFSERQQIEQNRKLVQGYRNARVANGVNRMPKAQTYEQEMAMRAAMAAIERGQRDSGVSKKQEFNNRLERGGLQKYDTRTRQNNTINRTAQAGGQLSNRQTAAQTRAARAERFAAPARPTPKTGGFGR